VYRFEKLNARELTTILDGLFETEEDEEKFIKDAEEKGATYSISIKVIDGNYKHETDQNTIYENIGTSSNAIFYDVYISSYDLENLINWRNERKV